MESLLFRAPALVVALTVLVVFAPRAGASEQVPLLPDWSEGNHDPLSQLEDAKLQTTENNWTSLYPFAPRARDGHAAAYVARTDRIVMFGGKSYPAAFLADSDETWSFDLRNDSWTELEPAIQPSARFGHAMVYDSRANLVVLFGGGSFGYGNETWLYDPAANAWRDANPSTRPGPFRVPAMAYDSKSNRAVLFGGYPSVGGRVGETWSYDALGNLWTNLTTGVGPTERSAHSMAYDSRSDRTLLYGGRTQAGVTNDTWSYDFNSNTWTELNPVGAPTAGIGRAMAYDSQSDRIVLFGGFTDEHGDETWVYDPNAGTWTNVTVATKPPARASPAIVYGEKFDRVVVVGGATVAGGDGPDVWAYDFETNNWTNANPKPPPEARDGHAMVYDSGADRVVLFGGGVGGRLSNETWSFDFDTNTWANRRPSASPPARIWPGLAYDAQSDRVILFGGYSGASEIGDTWTYDFDSDTWTLQTPAGGPASLAEHAMAYDARRDRVVLFGGITNVGTLRKNETWTYDFDANLWVNMNPVPAPRAQYGGNMVYDSLAERIIGFFFPETWMYDLGNNTWTNLTPQGLPHADGWGFAIAYDPVFDRTVLFGGPTPDTPPRHFSNETWAYDLNANAWSNLNPAIVPPPRFLAAMAYDVQSSRIVLYGGFKGGTCTWRCGSDGTWSYPSAPAPLSAVVTASRASVDAGQNLIFRCVASGGVPPYTYAWTFSDSQTGTGPSVDHSYSTAGPAAATCTARDVTNLTASQTLTVTVFPLPTVSVVASPTSLLQGGSLTLTATAQDGSGGLTYSWTGLPPGCAPANSALIACVPGVAGTYAVSVTVTDSNNGTGTGSATITVDASFGGMPYTQGLLVYGGSISAILLAVVALLIIAQRRRRRGKDSGGPNPPSP